MPKHRPPQKAPSQTPTERRTRLEVMQLAEMLLKAKAEHEKRGRGRIRDPEILRLESAVRGYAGTLLGTLQSRIELENPDAKGQTKLNNAYGDLKGLENDLKQADPNYFRPPDDFSRHQA